MLSGRSRAANGLIAAFLIVVLLAPGHAAEGKSAINFCNVGNTTLFVVMVGPTPRGTMAIEGWREIHIGDCQSVAASFHSVVGFAVEQSNGRKSMQIYDPTLFANPAVIATEWEYCVAPEKNFHQEGRLSMYCPTVCGAGEVPARFAFHVKPKMNETVTLRIPTDKDGDIIPLPDPVNLRPFEPNAWVPEPNAKFVLAMKGLAEQQELLDFRIARHEPSPATSWSARYMRDLGVVVRPETHAVSVIKDSPAYRAGIRQGDEIIEIDNIKLNSAWHARSLLVRTRPGETHALTFSHAGELYTRQVMLDPLPADLALTELHPKRGWLGTEFESAARVVGVIYRDGTPHLELDDDIQRIGREDFDGVDGLAEWLNRNRGNPTVELQVWRPSTRKIFVMKVGKLM